MVEKNGKDSESLKIPKWVWGIVGSLSSLVFILLASFFSWLGITTTHHGKVLEGNRVQIGNIGSNVNKIQQKLDQLPPKEFLTLPIEVKALQEDTSRTENKLEALERRVDKLEQLRNTP